MHTNIGPSNTLLLRILFFLYGALRIHRQYSLHLAAKQQTVFYCILSFLVCFVAFSYTLCLLTNCIFVLQVLTLSGAVASETAASVVFHKYCLKSFKKIIPVDSKNDEHTEKFFL